LLNRENVPRSQSEMNLDNPSIPTQAGSFGLLNTESQTSMNVLRTDLDYKMGEVTLIGGNPY